MKKRTSIIWTTDKNELIEIVSSKSSISSILNHFGLKNIGGNYRTLKARLAKDQIDYSHIKSGIGSNLGRKFGLNPKIPTQDILCENSSVRISSKLKERLIREGILTNDKCEICKHPPEWHGKPLVFVLDHKNGKSSDNRKENLRLICPNCNSQTPTFAGRNSPLKRQRNNCQKCGAVIGLQNKSCICKVCLNKLPRLSRRKVLNRPSKEEIDVLLQTMTWTSIGKKYGVSCNAVRKWFNTTRQSS